MINKFSEDTAVGIITCNRPEFVEQLLQSIDPSVGSIFLINSGNDIELSLDSKTKLSEYIKTEISPTPVGRAKNQILRKMRHLGFKYLFLIEDDVKIKDNKVFEKYITTAAATGLWAGQLSYGTHGGKSGGNIDPEGNPRVETVDYDSCSINLYPQSFQAFTLYHSNVFKIIGYFDDFYENAGEHLDHYYLSFLHGLGNYFWYFPDIENSWEYLEDIDKDHSESVIRKSPKWRENMQKAWAWFNKKYGKSPTDIPKVTLDKVSDRLNFLELNYSKKELL